MHPKALWLIEILLAGLTLFFRPPDVSSVTSNDFSLFSFLLVMGTLTSFINEAFEPNSQNERNFAEFGPAMTFVGLLAAAIIFILLYSGESISFVLAGLAGLCTLISCTMIRRHFIWKFWPDENESNGWNFRDFLHRRRIQIEEASPADEYPEIELI